MNLCATVSESHGAEHDTHAGWSGRLEAIDAFLTLLAKAVRQLHAYPVTSPVCVDAVNACRAHLVAIDGPGLKADGTYLARAGTAEAVLQERNGVVPQGAPAGKAAFTMIAGEQLILETGIPGEAPVQLVRSAPGVVKLPTPSLAQTASDSRVDPVTLM